MMRVISSSPYARLGFTNDPAETETWCGWVRLRNWTLYLFGYGIVADDGKIVQLAWKVR